MLGGQEQNRGKLRGRATANEGLAAETSQLPHERGHFSETKGKPQWWSHPDLESKLLQSASLQVQGTQPASVPTKRDHACHTKPPYPWFHPVHI